VNAPGATACDRVITCNLVAYILKSCLGRTRGLNSIAHRELSGHNNPFEQRGQTLGLYMGRVLLQALRVLIDEAAFSRKIRSLSAELSLFIP
jgi:hypothetical protein